MNPSRVLEVFTLAAPATARLRSLPVALPAGRFLFAADGVVFCPQTDTFYYSSPERRAEWRASRPGHAGA